MIVIRHGDGLPVGAGLSVPARGDGSRGGDGDEGAVVWVVEVAICVLEDGVGGPGGGVLGVEEAGEIVVDGVAPGPREEGHVGWWPVLDEGPRLIRPPGTSDRDLARSELARLGSRPLPRPLRVAGWFAASTRPHSSLAPPGPPSTLSSRSIPPSPPAIPLVIRGTAPRYPRYIRPELVESSTLLSSFLALSVEYQHRPTTRA